MGGGILFFIFIALGVQRGLILFLEHNGPSLINKKRKRDGYLAH